MTNNKNLIYSIVILIFCVATYWLLVGKESMSLSEKVMQAPLVEEAKQAQEQSDLLGKEDSAEIIDVEGKIQKVSESFRSRLNSLEFPDIESYKEEVSKNPHGTPPSIIKAAVDLGNLYDRVRSPQEALLFTEKMSGCVKQRGPETVRSLCLGYVKKLSQRYPQYKETYTDLYDELPERLQKTHDFVEKVKN